MNGLRYILLFCLLPFCNLAQSALNIGLGRTFEPNLYNPSLNIDLNYLVRTSFHNLALKTGTELEPGSSYGLKYNFYLMGGYCTDLEKPLSFHAFAGVADNTSAHRTSIGSSLALNETSSYIFNVGGFMRIGREKKFLLGLEAYAWKQWLNKSNRDSYVNNAIAINLTIGYRFDFPKRKLDPSEKPNLNPYNLSIPH